MIMNHFFEQGPIRPPSEARSLLIRVTRNCPWNQCAFCHTYRNTKFELRSVDEVKTDVQAASDMAEEIKAISWKLGEGGVVGPLTANRIFENGDPQGDPFRSVAAWLYFGGESVFLQDANSIILKTEDLVEILRFIKEKFPHVNSITSYCRSKTAAKKSVEDFKRLRDAGLNRIHVGLETGFDPLLKFIRKGVTAAEQIEGGRRIVASGISLCEYVMPGLGGKRWSKEHAQETARVLNQINPAHIRLRSLQVRAGTSLHDLMQGGSFEPLGDDDVVREIRAFIEALDGIESMVVSDHILNLLEEVEGKLPAGKKHIIDIIDKYLMMPDEDRLIFQLGRRKGLYRRLGDLADRSVYLRLRQLVSDYLSADPAQMDRDIDRIRQNFI
jgi:biotin synthase-like enzyme